MFQCHVYDLEIDGLNPVHNVTRRRITPVSKHGTVMDGWLIDDDDDDDEEVLWPF